MVELRTDDIPGSSNLSEGYCNLDHPFEQCNHLIHACSWNADCYQYTHRITDWQTERESCQKVPAFSIVYRNCSDNHLGNSSVLSEASDLRVLHKHPRNIRGNWGNVYVSRDPILIWLWSGSKLRCVERNRQIRACHSDGNYFLLFHRSSTLVHFRLSLWLGDTWSLGCPSPRLSLPLFYHSLSHHFSLWLDTHC